MLLMNPQPMLRGVSIVGSLSTFQFLQSRVSIVTGMARNGRSVDCIEWRQCKRLDQTGYTHVDVPIRLFNHGPTSIQLDVRGLPRLHVYASIPGLHLIP
jgi:hypothetical protein